MYIDWDLLFPFAFAVILTLTVGGVILLKPISNKLGHLLEAMAKERASPRLNDELRLVRELLETMNARIDLMEERQEFTEALLSDPDRKRLRLKGHAGPEGEAE